ncbi:MAG: chromosome segregation protein SMC, partial [Burkholderiales bacterium]
YAIIEQDMISRLVEARPEQLREFLEEAAGVSKYRERRRETEARLRDTRDNLLRIEDIRRELDQQLQRLQTQAEVAQRYNELQQRLVNTQNSMWVLKKREAAAQRQRAAAEAQQLTLQNEAQNTALHNLDKQLEQARVAHYAHGDALNAAQGRLYSTNADVARLEQTLQHKRETRQRLTTQLDAQNQQQHTLRRQLGEAQQNLEAWRGELAATQQHQLDTETELEVARQALPKAEGGLNEAQMRLEQWRHQLAQAELACKLEETHLAHAEKNLQQLETRRDPLLSELAHLGSQQESGEDERELADMAAQRSAAQAELTGFQEALAARQTDLHEAQQTTQQHAQRLARHEARLHALQGMQYTLDHKDELSGWLEKHGLSDLARLWRGIHITAGWETALENILGERLNAIAVDSLARLPAGGDDTPPGALAIYDHGIGEASAQQPEIAGLPTLRAHVTWDTEHPGSAGIAGLLDDWLHGVYVLGNDRDAWTLREQLPLGACLVSSAGHVFTRHSVMFHAPQSEWHGVLKRQREIDELQVGVGALAKQHADDNVTETRHREEFAALQQHTERVRQRVEELQAGHHALQLEAQRRAHQRERVRQRGEQIQQELNEIAMRMLSERAHSEEYAENMRHSAQQCATFKERLASVQQHVEAAQASLDAARQRLQIAERNAQEAAFANIINIRKISDVNEYIKSVHEQLMQIENHITSVSTELNEIDLETLSGHLNAALSQRSTREEALTLARGVLEQATAELQDIERQRMLCEREAHALHDKLAEARLKEQEGRLQEEQCVEQLQAGGFDEDQSNLEIDARATPNSMQSAITRLKDQIAAIGAVNLTAPEELQSAAQRKDYMGAQSADLNEAIATLEHAIRKIDRETRERLLVTFDAVNANLAELFPALFGGGQARLVLTGEEILDAGIELIAQPPGKKNTSIHPLSGGEKALTALALVFALFQLNPAPFCLLDEVDAPLDDANTLRFCELLKKMSESTQFIFISHNKLTMEMAEQLIGVTMQESGVSRVVAVDIEEAIRLREAVAA